jgi:hypothetical protein
MNAQTYMLLGIRTGTQKHNHVPEITMQFARKALENGVCVKMDANNIASDALQARQQLRQNAICILSAKRCRSRRIAGSAGFADVLQIIARCMWGARLTEDFWFK